MAATPRSNTRNNSNTPDGSSVAATRKRTTAIILSNTGTHTCMHALGDRKEERQADTEREREKGETTAHPPPQT